MGRLLFSGPANPKKLTWTVAKVFKLGSWSLEALFQKGGQVAVIFYVITSAEELTRRPGVM